MRKLKHTKAPHRSTHRRELREHAHQASIKREPPPPPRTVFIYSTTVRGRHGSE